MAKIINHKNSLIPRHFSLTIFISPAVTIQRFTPQEFVAACSGYDVTIRCEGTGVEFYPDGSISSTGGEFT